MGEVAEFRGTTDCLIGATLARVNAALRTVNTLHDELKLTLDNAAVIAAQAADASPIPLQRNAVPADKLAADGWHSALDEFVKGQVLASPLVQVVRTPFKPKSA